MAAEQQEPLYEATLQEGQTYVYDGQVFEYDTPVLVNEGTYLYLKRYAKKSVSLGEDDQQIKRTSLPYFTFRKARVVEEVKPVLTPDEDEDDDLDEVEVPAGSMTAARRGLNVSEDAPPDLDPNRNKVDAVRPPARSRAAAREKARTTQ